MVFVIKLAPVCKVILEQVNVTKFQLFNKKSHTHSGINITSNGNPKANWQHSPIKTKFNINAISLY